MQQLAKLIMQICVAMQKRAALQSPLKNVIIKRVEKSFDPVSVRLHCTRSHSLDLLPHHTYLECFENFILCAYISNEILHLAPPKSLLHPILSLPLQLPLSLN